MYDDGELSIRNSDLILDYNVNLYETYHTLYQWSQPFPKANPKFRKNQVCKYRDPKTVFIQKDTR